MRSYENPPGGPPKPPEYGIPSAREVKIALMGFLWAAEKNRQNIRKDRQTLLRATDPNKRFKRTEDEKSFDVSRSILRHLRTDLDRDLETEGEGAGTLSESKFLTAVLDNPKLSLPIRKSFRSFFGNLFTFYKTLVQEIASKGILATLEPIKRHLTDQTFIDRFGYNAIVQGLDDETIALLPISNDTSRNPLYLGMTVSYAKKLEPSGHTGPLVGSGKIAAFLIPSREGDITPDQVIELVVQTEGGQLKTLLSLDEVAEKL